MVQPHHSVLLLLVKRMHAGIDECFNTSPAWCHFPLHQSWALCLAHVTRVDLKLASVHEVKERLSTCFRHMAEWKYQCKLHLVA